MKIPRCIVDPIARRKSKLTTAPVDRYRLRIARTAREYEDAFRLVHVGYVFQGIEELQEIDLRITEQHVLPEATVIVAYEGAQIVGTISLTEDSPARLPLDRDYPEVLEGLRREGARIAELGSLAIVRRCWHTGLAPLLGLAAARLAFQLRGATHQVIGVHPKAAVFYRAMFGFDTIGAPRPHAELRAPTVGMVHESGAVFAHLKKHFSRPMRTGASPFDYVFGHLECAGLEMPSALPEGSWERWKMPREVFQRLFIERSHRLAELSSQTLSHLRTQRTDRTLGRIQLAGGLH